MSLNRTKALQELGQFIFQEYNCVSGIYAYDPEGFMQDVNEQAEKIFEPEIAMIRAQAAIEREQLRSQELHLFRVECELAIEKSLNKAYAKIIEAFSSWKKDQSNDINTLKSETLRATFQMGDDIRNGMAVPLHHYGLNRMDRAQKFEAWLERHYC